MSPLALVAATLTLLVAGAAPAAEPDAAPGKIHPRLLGVMRDAAGADRDVRHDPRRGVRVLIRVEPPMEAASRRLRELGCTIERVRRDRVQAWVPVRALATLARERWIRSIRPAETLVPNGIARDASARGESPALSPPLPGALRGRNIRVGVISLGIRGLADSVAGGHLPATRFECQSGSRSITREGEGCRAGARLVRTRGGVTAWSVRSDRDLAPVGPGSAEGTAALELVHRQAPAADLWFVNPETVLDYLDGVEALAPRVDVIVSDIVSHADFPDGRSLLSETVTEILARRGTRTRAFVQPTGNLARAHSAAPFTDAATRGGPPGRHLFVADGDTEGPERPAAWNRITVPPAGAVTIFLTWDGVDEGARYGLRLVDCASGRALATAAADDAVPPEPPDVASYANPSPVAPAEVCYAIRRAGGGPGPSGLNVTIVDPGGEARHAFNTAASSLLPPADARGPIVAVGAVPASRPDRIEPFSSRGPTRDGRSKPDVVDLDRLPVSGAGGFPTPFVGTSAAAARLGGLAALLLEANPGLTAAALAAILRRTAVALDSADVYGAGRVDPARAIQDAQTLRRRPVADRRAEGR
jgi:hypothetical protein